MWIKIEPLKGRTQAAKETQAITELDQRYGHISFDTLKTLPECPKCNHKPRCEACEKGKATKQPAKRDGTIRTSRPLERLHADLVGPITPTTPSTQYRHLLVVTDDYSRYVATKPLRTKNETTEELIEIINALEKATTHQVTQIQADWGGEFRNKELAIELKQRGITLKETVPRHSETNAIAERANRTIFTMSRVAIIASKLPKSLWDKASAWAAYTKNRLPHKSLPEGKIPVELLLNRDPVKTRSNLRPFGQRVLCFDYNVKDKLSARSWEGRIVGYTLTHGTYQVMTPAGSFKLAKNPTPIQDDEPPESESEEENPTLETTQGILEETAPPQSGESGTIPIPATMPEPPPAPRKKRRTAAEWEEKVGSRFSMRE